jgi:hypothetical protein
MTNRNNHTEFQEADTSFLMNFGSKALKPIRISLPTPPPLKFIAGYKLPTEDQYFRRLEFPETLKELELECYEYFKNKRGANNYDVINKFWELLENGGKRFIAEIKWMKHFRWHMEHGYWFFNEGKPTYITGWNFSYLHLHWMTLRKGEGYPTYDERQRRRFLFRKYLYETTETFQDLDEKGFAIKVDGKYRMRDLGKRTFLGAIEPKGRREGLTNEFCHIVTRVMTETFGADNLGTVVSMDGDNAETHFKKKLVPAFKKWPIFVQPIWRGGVTDIEFTTPKTVLNPNVRILGSSVNYTESGSDVANDGKKIMCAGYDEQGKGKRVGNVGNRWQINKETMTLEAGADIIGFCTHPSTVEKMEEGGQDYKEMCDMSNFYHRVIEGQTVSGLALSYMPTSFSLRGFTDRFGNPVLLRPTARQIFLGYNKELGSQTWIAKRRNQLFDEKDSKKMEEYRSFVRKFPEDYSDCWKGVAGYIGFPIETIENRGIELENHPEHVRGRLEWINNTRFGKVEFVHDDSGHWVVSKLMPLKDASLKTTMDYYDGLVDEYIPMYRPMYPGKGIVGVDPHEFNNKGESRMLKSHSKLSDTGIVVYNKRDKVKDPGEDESKWTTPRAIGNFDGRIINSELVAEESLKAAIYWGFLIHLERNKSEVWAWLIKWKYGGYMNHHAEKLPNGEIQIDQSPGTFLGGVSKKRVFNLMKDQLVNHAGIEQIPSLLKSLVGISSMEELTRYDDIAAYMAALDGARSIYSEIMEYQSNTEDVMCLGIEGKRV